jgi:hypothetical protein
MSRDNTSSRFENWNTNWQQRRYKALAAAATARRFDRFVDFVDKVRCSKQLRRAIFCVLSE